MIIERRDILERCFHDCMKEMYEKAQPSADYDQLIQDYIDGKIGKDETVYDRYYLSNEEFTYIKDKYKEAYRIKEEWRDNIEVLERYLNEGGSKDKYIPEQTDEDGFTHPGYRSYEKVPPLKEHIKNILDQHLETTELPQVRVELADELTNKVMELISACKDFYKFDREETQYEFSVCLGASPTSNKETVKKWWKENKGIDVDIVERNPLLFWEYDNYGEEIDNVMSEEYGDNWKEHFDKEWKEEKEQKRLEYERKIKELEEQLKEENGKE